MSNEEARNAAAAVDEDVPTLEAAEVPQAGKQSKRYAKVMGKMGLKPEPTVNKVSIRKTGSLSFTVPEAEVYRFPNTNTFVIFGEAKIENLGSLNQEAAARAAVSAGAAPKATNVEEVVEEDIDDNMDAGGLDEKEINVVMSQANVSRGKAIRALQKNNGDVVNTIMDLTL